MQKLSHRTKEQARELLALEYGYKTPASAIQDIDLFPLEPRQQGVKDYYARYALIFDRWTRRTGNKILMAISIIIIAMSLMGGVAYFLYQLQLFFK